MSIRPLDLRDILDYVPRFRNHVFVISLDGTIIADPNIDSILTDIAVLHNLGIKLVICHGIGHQLCEVAAKSKVTISDARGEGPTDQQTLDLAIQAAQETTSKVISGLASKGLPYSISNAVEARPIGVVDGVNQMQTGIATNPNRKKIERLLDSGDIPVFPPIVHDSKGRNLRVNSDQLAAALAKGIEASKLIYLCASSNLTIDDVPFLNISSKAIRETLNDRPEALPVELISKARHAVNVLDAETDRVHLLDGRIDGVLLLEIFDKVGLGTMIHSNEYDRIRKATMEDLSAVHALLKQASRHSLVIEKTLDSLAEVIETFFVYEVDESIMGCVRLIQYNEPRIAEIGSISVQPYQQGKGIGYKLAKYAIDNAIRLEFSKIFALSTQASEFFTEKLGFELGEIGNLPAERRAAYEENRRNSIILFKEL